MVAFKRCRALNSKTSLVKRRVTCQDYGNGYHTAYAHLANEQVDYVIHLGDYIYESIASNFQASPARLVPPFPSGSTTIPVDLNDYRHLYQVYRSDPNLQADLENFAFIQLWDDHEFANDCHERQALLNPIQKAKVHNFIALTGDLQTFLAGYLKPTFDDIFASPMGIELMVGSITSANLAEDIESAARTPWSR